MSAACLSPSKDRFSRFFVWTVESEYTFGSTLSSDVFSFQGMKCRFKFFDLEKGKMQLVLTEGHLAGPFILTVLAETRDTKPACLTLACDRVAELPWECTFSGISLFENATLVEESVYIIRFVFIFEMDSIWTDCKELPLQTECAQGTSNNSNFPSNLENLSLDFANLLKNETLPDVKLKCKGRDNAIPAHRAVLAARSEVFAAMFRNEMAESRSGEVNIDDVDDDVIDPFLQYVYSGEIPTGVSDEVVPGLYSAADKYAVHALRKTCRERMVDGLTGENCVNYLTLADAHGDAEFKKSVIGYICGHESVLKGEAWREFAKKPSKLVVEVYHSFVELKTNTIQTEEKSN